MTWPHHIIWARQLTLLHIFELWSLSGLLSAPCLSPLTHSLPHLQNSPIPLHKYSRLTQIFKTTHPGPAHTGQAGQSSSRCQADPGHSALPGQSTKFMTNFCMLVFLKSLVLNEGIKGRSNF